MEKYKVMYFIGITASLLTGILHFFVPLMFQWYSYIPQEYQNLIVGIDYTNLCFSLLLSGISLILLVWNKKVLAKNKEAVTIYGFVVGVWIFRTALTIIEPWPVEPIAWAAHLQVVGAALVMVLLLVPYIKIRFQKDENS